MWYFTWILGVLLACAFGVINVMWLEMTHSIDDETVKFKENRTLPDSNENGE